uniref:Ovule protein n=1 Tax=Romanomermis culicivorax TaxID=13658 RepID=A0A915K7Q2_ROMCU
MEIWNRQAPHFQCTNFVVKLTSKKSLKWDFLLLRRPKCCNLKQISCRTVLVLNSQNYVKREKWENKRLLGQEHFHRL